MTYRANKREPHKDDPVLNRAISALEIICVSAKNQKTAQNLFKLICEISIIFEELNEKQIVAIVRTQSFYIDIMVNVFLSESFISNLKELMHEYPDNEEKIESLEVINKKKLIKVNLYLATFMLAYCAPYLGQKNIEYLRSMFKLSLRKIKSTSLEEFEILDICNYLYNIEVSDLYNYKGIFIGKIQTKSFFNHQSISRLIMGMMIHIIQGTALLSNRFKHASKLIQSIQRDYALEAIVFLSKTIHGYDKGFTYFKTKMFDLYKNDTISKKFIDNFMYVNEKHIYFILKTFIQETKNAHDDQIKFALKHLTVSSSTKKILSDYAKLNFQAYKGKIEEDHREWANKIYLTTYKTVSVLETINDAVDTNWKLDVSFYEFRSWINQVHHSINKDEIEDDWDRVVNFVTEENKRVEWKSSFYISTEGQFISEEVERTGAYDTLKAIIRTMIGMMNTEGGTLIVGLVEKPEKILREDIRNNIITKNKVTFFDIGWELDRLGKKHDDLNQQILDALKDHTLLTAEVFNGLWTSEPINIRSNYREITIYKIKIAKSDKHLFSAKREGGAVSLSLLKRAEGRTIQVDPREYISVIRE